MFKKNSKDILVVMGIILISIFSFLFYNLAFALEPGSSDAIAVRVLPNPNHYGINKWYQSQGIKGSPQALIVDGFEAVRNGRSVYVAATNISDVDSSNMLSVNDLLYTNIFIISYNQEVKDDTIDILGQLISNWKFNTNITLPGRCFKNLSSICTYNKECPIDDYCQSSKAVIIRDTKRLADLADMNSALATYKNSHNGLCPKLLSGSYLAGKSISTWRSWQETLGKDLGIILPIDPINKLGRCHINTTENAKYDPITCWNQVDQEYSVSINPSFNLPIGSSAYSYAVSADDKSCSFYAPTETNLNCSSDSSCLITKNLFDPLNGYCGDGLVQTDLGEQCDDKNTNNDDNCTDNCRWSIKTIAQIPFSGGGNADALVYDINSQATSIDNANGTYLKLDKMLDTPYIWFADTNNNLVSQVRTFVKCYPYGSESHPDDKWNIDPSSQGKTGYICPKKVPDGWDYSFANHQHPGEIIKDFSIAGYPSRTAVNVETNEVWIGARSGAIWGTPGQVQKLQMDVNGDYSVAATIPDTQFAGRVRGLSIQKDGDIWIADCTSDPRTASIKRFSASNLALNKTIGADGSFVCPYGLAIDSEDNIWMNDNGGGGMKKINTITGQIYTYTDAIIYGITVDTNDNAWGGGYYEGYGIKKIPFGQNSGASTHFTNFTDSQTNMTGVTLDKDGNIWSGGYTPYYETYKFNQAGVLQPGFPVSSGGVNPHGIFGTSDGLVWQSHISSNIVRVFNSGGGIVADFKGGNVASGIYTYSDGTGLNRAMVMRSGIWVSTPTDSGFNNQHWGQVYWQENVQSTKQNIEVYARADNEIGNLKNKAWIRVYAVDSPLNVGATWNALSYTDSSKVGRFMQFKILLRSSERGVTPVVWDLKIK